MNKALQALFQKIKETKANLFALAIVITCGTVGLVGITYHLAYWQKIYPGITVLGKPIGNRTTEEAILNIKSRITDIESDKIILARDDQEWEIDLSELYFSYDATTTAQKAYRIGRSGNEIMDLNTKIQAWFSGVDLDLDYQINQNLLDSQIATIAAEVFIPAVEPTIEAFEATPAGALTRVAVEQGKEGQELDVRKTLSTINYQLSAINFDPIKLPIITVSPTLSGEELERTKVRAENFLDKKLVLSLDETRWELLENELIKFLSFSGDFDEEKIASYTATLAKNINRPPQNATFQFEGGRVTQFRPAKEGQTLEEEKTLQLIKVALGKIENGEEEKPTIKLPITTTPPAVTIAEINDLGIKELLGRGVSYFRGSIASRIHNIQLASSGLNGLLISPGETFSFNQALGEVSQTTGYREAYIIKEGRTILGDGGGVCQVSTTFFRAALEAGLPIIERHPHAYRVAYYEQGFPPGRDATVWEPSPDLKIKNDTPAHTLIQAYADTKRKILTFEFYGTSDGRIATIGKSRVWDQVPPPPDLYQDDPALPAGTVKQIDWKAWGAKVAFDWKVVRGNEVLQERTFYSAYRPWQAVYLRGTGPAQ